MTSLAYSLSLSFILSFTHLPTCLSSHPAIQPSICPFTHLFFRKAAVQTRSLYKVHLAFSMSACL